jgi:hypothetical protein
MEAGTDMGVTTLRQSKGSGILNEVDRITAKLQGMRKQSEEIEVKLGICKDVNVEELAKTPEEPNGFFERLQAKLKTFDHLSIQIKGSLDNIGSEF